MSSQKIGVRAIPSLVLQRPVSMLRPPSARSSAHKVQASAPVAAAKSPRPGVQVPKITVPRIPATSSTCMRFTQKSTGHETASPRSSMRISGTSKRTLTAAARSERGTPAQSQERLDMVASTGTDSSGVYSEPESNKQLKYTPRVAPHVISPRPSASHPSQARCSVTKPAISKTAKQQTVPNKDAFLIGELRHEIDTLKGQHAEYVVQLRHELAEQAKDEIAMVVAAKEAQFGEQLAQHAEQLAQRELQWQAESERKLVAQRGELEHRFEERLRKVEAHHKQEREQWSSRVDQLNAEVLQLTHDKERYENTIRDEVENRVQAVRQSYSELEKETCSLQVVYDLRCEEVRTLRQDLEKMGQLTAQVLTLRERNHTLLNTVEGLQAQLEHKSNEERRLQAEIHTMTSHYKEEIIKSRRLSMEKEELQWKLSLHSDQSFDLDGSRSTEVTTPAARRKVHHLPQLSPIVSDSSQANHETNNNDRTVNCDTSMPASAVDIYNSTPSKESLSGQPPESPTVRDFTEKNDSVAYVLDLGLEKQLATTPTTVPNSPRPVLMPPASPWQRRRNMIRFSSLRWSKPPSH